MGTPRCTLTFVAGWPKRSWNRRITSSESSAFLNAPHGHLPGAVVERQHGVRAAERRRRAPGLEGVERLVELRRAQPAAALRASRRRARRWRSTKRCSPEVVAALIGVAAARPRRVEQRQPQRVVVRLVPAVLAVVDDPHAERAARVGRGRPISAPGPRTGRACRSGARWCRARDRRSPWDWSRRAGTRPSAPCRATASRRGSRRRRGRRPAARRMRCTNVEPEALRVISSATRAGPRSMTRTVGLAAYSRAGDCTVS